MLSLGVKQQGREEGDGGGGWGGKRLGLVGGCTGGGFIGEKAGARWHGRRGRGRRQAREGGVVDVLEARGA